MIGQNTLALKKWTIQSFLLLTIKHENQPKPAKTTQKLPKSQPKPSTTNQIHPQQAKTTYNQPKTTITI